MGGQGDPTWFMAPAITSSCPTRRQRAAPLFPPQVPPRREEYSLPPAVLPDGPSEPCSVSSAVFSHDVVEKRHRRASSRLSPYTCPPEIAMYSVCAFNASRTKLEDKWLTFRISPRPTCPTRSMENLQNAIPGNTQVPKKRRRPAA